MLARAGQLGSQEIDVNPFGTAAVKECRLSGSCSICHQDRLKTFANVVEELNSKACGFETDF